MDLRTNAPRPYVLRETTYRRLQANPPNVAVLPWGATEAHGYHMPYGTDVIEAESFALRAAELAHGRGAKVVVLPAIPFGNDEQQLDQIATISITTSTAHAILRDVVRSLSRQGMDRLVLVNAHGGNEFKPIIRDVQSEFAGMLLVVANFFQMRKYQPDPACKVQGDHADEMEASLLLHLAPELLEMDQAGTGERRPFVIPGLNQPGVWTPRPWRASHPDTGSGDASHATAEKGREHIEAISASIAELLVGLSSAKRGDLPYV